MKFLGRTQMLSQYSILDSLAVIKGLGFDGVEICVERKDWSFNALDSLPVDAIRERVAELDLLPHSFSFHQDYIYNDEIFELTKQTIKLTPGLRTDIFVCSGVKRKTGDAEEWARMVDRTRALTQVAEDCGVTIAKEFEPDFIAGSTADMIRLFNEIPSPNLAANVDLGHVYICDPHPIATLRQFGSKMVHGHISGMPAGQHDHLIPQEGEMDVALYLRTLKEMGFKGGLALDLYKYDYEAVSKEAVACLRKMRDAA